MIVPSPPDGVSSGFITGAAGETLTGKHWTKGREYLRRDFFKSFYTTKNLQTGRKLVKCNHIGERNIKRKMFKLKFT